MKRVDCRLVGGPCDGQVLRVPVRDVAFLPREILMPMYKARGPRPQLRSRDLQRYRYSGTQDGAAFFAAVAEVGSGG